MTVICEGGPWAGKSIEVCCPCTLYVYCKKSGGTGYYAVESGGKPAAWFYP